MTNRVLVTPSLLYQQPGPYREVLEAAGLEVVYPSKGGDSLAGGRLLEALAGVSGVLAGAEPFTREILAASGVCVLARMGVGYDAIDMDAANELGVVVTITPGTNEHSVAEQAIALIFGVYRGVAWRDRNVRRGVWDRTPLGRLAGRTLGLVGLGRIGRAIAPRAIGLGLRVIAADPCADEQYCERHGVALRSFERLLDESDIVSLHLPCTVETRNLINLSTLALMKPGSVLINTSRGGLVDETALAAALASGHLAGAGLDVFQSEPLPLTSPLLAFEHVVLAPHMGGLDIESTEAMATLAARCLADLYQGRWPDGCVVNEQLRAGWRWR